jgi:hypothetical protein
VVGAADRRIFHVHPEWAKACRVIPAGPFCLDQARETVMSRDPEQAVKPIVRRATEPATHRMAT